MCHMSILRVRLSCEHWDQRAETLHHYPERTLFATVRHDPTRRSAWRAIQTLLTMLPWFLDLPRVYKCKMPFDGNHTEHPRV